MQDIALRINLQTAEALTKLNGFLAQAKAEFAGLLGVSLTIEGIKELTSKWLEYSVAVFHAGQKAGIATEEFSGLAFAASMQDINIEALQTGLKKFSQYLVKSGDDTHDMTKALLEQSRIFQAMPDGAGKAALAVERFGKAGTALIPLLDQGPEKMQELIEKGINLAGVTKDDAEESEHFSQSLKALKLSAEAFTGALLTLLPQVTALTEKMTIFFGMLKIGAQYFNGDWIKRFFLADIESAVKAAGKLIEDLKPPPLIQDKGDYEHLSSEYELKLKMVELSLKAEETDTKSYTTEEARQARINQLLDAKVKALQDIQHLNDAALDIGVITKDQHESKNFDSNKNILETLDKKQTPSVWGQMHEEMNAYNKAQGTVSRQIANNFVSVVGGAIKTVSQNFTDLIMGTKNWAQALLAIGMNILTSVVSAIVEMGVKWVTTHVIMGGALAAFHALANALGWSTTTSQIAQETAKAPSLQANAVASSASSWGASAIIGVIALVAAVGIGIAAMAGAFRERGGPVTAGQPYIVGEKRPELFVPNQSGYIVPQVPSASSYMAQSSPSPSVHNNMAIAVHNWNDEAAMTKHIRDNPEVNHIILDKVKRNSHVIGARV